MLEYFIEELQKASDRIKSGIKTKRHDNKMSNKDMHNALGSLLASDKLSDSVKQQLTQVHKDFGTRAEKEEAMRSRAAFKVKDFEPGKNAEKQTAKEQQEKETYDAYLKEKAPTKINKLGHAKQYEQDVNHPKMRSKAAEATSSGVKDKLMGENVAIRDKSYGQALDAQAQLKQKAAKIQEAKGPSEVIRIPNAPEVPDEHKNDSVVSNLMSLRHSLTDSNHVKAVDDHITKRIGQLKGLNKSLFKNNQQWTIK